MAETSGTPIPQKGLVKHGTVTNVVSATQFDADALQGMGDNYFARWIVYVDRLSTGGLGAPQGEQKLCTAFVSSTGRVTHTAFSALLRVGDEILMIHPNLGGALITSIVEMLSRSRDSLYDGWKDELGIDFTVWAVTNPATGVAWNRVPAAGAAYLRATSVPNANETARLVTTTRWINAPDTYGINTIIRRMIVEFEFRLANVVNIDNTLSLFALTPNQADNRASNNICGFALIGDALQTVTDDAGAETVNTGFGETLTNWNKLRIDIQPGQVLFYLNETLIATHAINLPDIPSFLNFFVDTEAGGPATIEVGIVRIWHEDMVRP